MTIAELIKELGQYPPDTEVTFGEAYEDENGMLCYGRDIAEVEYNPPVEETRAYVALKDKDADAREHDANETHTQNWFARPRPQYSEARYKKVGEEKHIAE